MNNERKKILIVDDDEAILESLKEILQFKGYQVDTAETGLEAIEKSKMRLYHVALLDIKLPDMDGTELLAKMQSTTPKMMKIMVTGYPSLENAVKALNHKADAYIIKPVNPEDLLNIIGEKLKEQEELEKINEQKVTEWITMRIQKLEDEQQTYF